MFNTTGDCGTSSTRQLEKIFSYYRKNSKKYFQTTDHSRTRMSVRIRNPLERLRSSIDIYKAIVFTQNGEYNRGLCKEMYYHNPKKIEGEPQGLYIVPSADTVTGDSLNENKRQPCCYAFIQSFPVYKWPYCVYDLVINPQKREPTKKLTVLGKDYTKAFEIYFYHYFERSEEGRFLIRVHNYKQDKKWLTKIINEYQQWSDDNFIQIKGGPNEAAVK